MGFELLRYWCVCSQRVGLFQSTYVDIFFLCARGDIRAVFWYFLMPSLELKGYRKPSCRTPPSAVAALPHFGVEA